MFDARIKDHMEVVGADGAHVGRVDHVKGEMIELARFDHGSGLRHHLIPMSWVERVDAKVRLDRGADEAKAEWIEG